MSNAEPSQHQGRRSIGARRNLDTRDAVLRAAEDIHLEFGLGGFSVEAVAKRARAGKPTIYKWWPSRADLLLEVYHRQKPLAVAWAGPFEDDLVEFVCALFRWWQNGAGAVLCSIVAEAQRDPSAALALQGYLDVRRAELESAFRTSLLRDQLRPAIRPDVAAELVLSFIMQRLISGRLAIDVEQVRDVVRQIFGGVPVGADGNPQVD